MAGLAEYLTDARFSLSGPLAENHAGLSQHLCHSTASLYLGK